MMSMMTFEFVRDDALRHAIEADYADLHLCEDAAIPAVILAALICERLLVDLLERADPDRFTPAALATVALADLIDRCHERSLIPPQVRTWAMPLIDYQGLLGRDPAKRPPIAAGSARIASLVVESIAQASLDHYVRRVGLSAQEIERQIAGSRSIESVLETNGGRVDDDVARQLLTETLPRRAVLAVQADGVESPQVGRVAEMVDVIFGVTTDMVRTRAVETWLTALDRAPERVAAGYEVTLLRGTYFTYAGARRETARTWLLRRFLSPIPPVVLERLAGALVTLFPGDPGTLVDALVQAMFLNPDQRPALLDFFKLECFGLSVDQSDEVLGRIEGWFERVDTESGGDYVLSLTQLMTIAAIMQAHTG